MHNTRIALLGGVALAIALVALPPARAGDGASGGPPTDYTKVEGLSQPVHDTVREAVEVEMRDGTHLYVEVVRPDAPGRYPVVMEASPYHGTLADRDGTRIFPDAKGESGEKIGLTGYFAPRGYAVVMVDLRGTGRSGGCLDHLGPNDASDLKEIVEWAADQPWSSGRVGMTGHSYVGSTPAVAAAQAPRGLVTIAPSAGLASMYDHQFHNGVPWFLQWAGPQWAYEEMAMGRDLPPGGPDVVHGYEWGDNAGNAPNPEFGCGWRTSALSAGPGQLYGQYDPWHAERDWDDEATAADIPVFMVHGVNDNAARIPSAEWFFGHRFERNGDKVWLGQWDHGSSSNTTCDEAHPNCRFDQWMHALHAWFDRHLQGRDVDTGPPVEVFLNTGEVWTARSWTAPPAALTLAPDAVSGTLGRRPAGEGAAAFTTVPAGTTTAAPGVEFRTGRLSRDMLFVGVPAMRLRVSLATSQALNLVATLYREDPKGERHPMTHCAVQPQLREGLDDPRPVTPGEVMDLRPQCFTMAHLVPQGERMVLEVDTASPHHLSSHATDLRVTVHTGPDGTRIALPIAGHPVVHPDVPLRADLPAGPAQATIRESDVTRAPGGGVRAGEVTSSALEFDVTSEANARLEAVVRWEGGGDVDLYLQRQQADGTWSEDLAAGESAESDHERLQLQLPQTGRYRLEMHNWLGPPGEELAIVVTFFDRDGAPGPG